MHRTYAAAAALLAIALFAPACSRSRERGTAVRICWQCNDTFTAYLNGRPLEPRMIREGDPHLRVWQQEATLHPGDILGFAVVNTKGARHFTAAVFAGDRLLFGTDTSRWVAAAAEPAADWWTRPPAPTDPAARAESAEVVDKNVALFREALALPPDRAAPIWGPEDRSALKRAVTEADLRAP